MSISSDQIGRRSQRLESLQAFRGLAAIWVLFYHLHSLSSRHLGEEYLYGWLRSGHLGVDFFFVLSGFIIYYVHHKDLGRAEYSAIYLAKRVLRVFPLLLILTLAKICWVLFGLPGVPADKANVSTYIHSLLLLPSEGGPLIDVAWTLSHEMWFYLLFLIALILGKSLGKIILFTTIGLSLLIQITDVSKESFILGFLFSAYNFQFIAGIGVAMIVLRASKLPRWEWIFGISLIILASLLSVYNHLTEWSQLAQRTLWAICFASCVLAGISFDSDSTKRVPRLLNYLGNASYAIYLSHSSFQVAGFLIWKKFLMDAIPMNQALSIIGLCSLGGSLIVHHWVERPLGKISAKWIGKMKVRQTLLSAAI